MMVPTSRRSSLARVALLPLGFAIAAATTACAVDVAPDDGTDVATPPAEVGGKADGAFGNPDADRWAEILARCTPPADDEPVVYSNDFHWNYTTEEMAARFDEIYVSGKRLAERARVEEETGELILPIFEGWGSRVVLSRRLVENVTAHIEIALERGYAEHVFFPDMGHSHFFIPQERYDAEYASVPVPEIALKLTRMMDDPELLVLYHTAEQLKMLDEEEQVLPDEWIQWRHETRNVVGDNDGQGRIELLQNPDSAANTSRDYPGYRYHGAGFNVSASAAGCFPYMQNGELRWYDLSLSDLPYLSDGGADDWM
ncbi:MAG: hypothetical protein JRI23_10855 [Deltaproteobacteria bacterium]|jgi:hypothetical protein|nr:hypothetical protein [Deltaproteobacteria bacterium]MBW2532177.1 hypothetical protein [Deltaproteobacteria bacterium]